MSHESLQGINPLQLIDLLRLIQRRVIDETRAGGNQVDDNAGLTSSFLATRIIKLNNEYPKPQLLMAVPQNYLNDPRTFATQLEVELSKLANDGAIIKTENIINHEGKPKTLLFYSPFPESRTK